jgi:hypothetical protein
VFPVPWSSRWSWSLHLFLGEALISQIYFGIELYMFRTGFLSVIRSTVYTAIDICHKILCRISASKIKMEFHLSKTCRVLLQNKFDKISASCWFLL